MPLPKYSSRYPIEREVLDYALANGGARYTLDTPGKAVHFRQRAYAFRKVLWGELNAANPSPSIPTPYDLITITADGCDCIISIESASAKGTLAPLVTPSEPSALETEASDLAKRLGLSL